MVLLLAWALPVVLARPEQLPVLALRELAVLPQGQSPALEPQVPGAPQVPALLPVVARPPSQRPVLARRVRAARRVQEHLPVVARPPVRVEVAEAVPRTRSRSSATEGR